jgi:phenylacetate-CoA ligase
MSIDFRLRDFFHPFLIRRLHDEFERNQWRHPEELAAWQDRRVAALADHAIRQVPYYRRLARALGIGPGDIRRAGDLKSFPLLHKSDLRQHASELTADNAAVFGPVPASTSGTSGEPVTFLLDRESNCLEFVYYWRHWGWAGYRLGDRFAELGSQFFLVRPHLGDRPWFLQRHLRRLVLNSGQMSASGAREMVAAMWRFRPRFLKGTASSLFFFAWSLREGRSSVPPLAAVFSTGETLQSHYRRTIEETFGCRVLDSYGHMERTVGISECPAGGYHVNSDYGLLELGTRRPSEGGTWTAPVIGTGLYNRAMPLIRYVSGDEVEVSDDQGPCRCGRTLPLVRRVVGRSRDVLRTPDGRFVTTLFLVPELVHGVRFLQYRQVAEDRVVICIVPAEGWNEACRQEILDYSKRLLGESMTIQTDLLSSLDQLRDPSGKLRVVVGLERQPDPACPVS